MSWQRLRKVWQRTLFFPAQADHDLDDEIRFHLAEEARLRADRGLSEAEAAAAARRAFGNVALAREDTRAVWVSTRLEQILQDLRFGSRILTRSPAVSATAIVLIALVIGGNTTVFSIAHSVLTKPAPGVHASRLATVSWVAGSGDIETHAREEVYALFREHGTAFQPIAAFDFVRLTLTLDSGSYAVRGGSVSPNYFETLGVRLAQGRSFTVEEAARGTSGLVVVLAHHVWQNSFGGTLDIVGRAVTVNGQPATVIGVAEAGFRGAIFAEMADLWLPQSADVRTRLQLQRSGDVAMIGRRSAGASLSEAHAQLATLWAQFQQAHPEVNQTVKVRLVAYSGTAGGNSLVATRGNRMLAVFSAVTLLTIVIVCANITNLLIARAVGRQREMAVRQSLGASRARIVRGLLAEGLVLSLVAWIAACLFAWWVSSAVVPFLVPDSAGAVVTPDLTPDWTVVGYALGLALLCTIAVTVGPALRTRRLELLPFLKVGDQGVVPGRSRLAHGLVILQLAFSMLLLTSAGLARRSLSLQDSLEVGFDTAGILLATVNTAASATAPESNAAVLEALKARLEQLPGVEAVSYVGGRRLSGWIDLPVRREQSSESVLAVDNVVAPGYFATVDVPLVAGHDFVAGRQSARSARSAIITRHLAETLWPGELAVGKTLLAGPVEHPARAEVIGVVEDAFFSGRGAEGRPRYVFFSAIERPAPPGESTFYIRHGSSLDAIAPAVTRGLREADGRIPIASLRSLQSWIAGEAAPFWILTTLLSLFAGGSLIIAAIGQYAVVAFDGRRRTREFGLRIALGASAGQLVAGVMAESFRVTAIGIGAGFALSVAAGSVMARFLFGITPTDPPTFLAVFALLTVASLVACYLPARRAARTDPLVALRTE